MAKVKFSSGNPGDPDNPDKEDKITKAIKDGFIDAVKELRKSNTFSKTSNTKKAPSTPAQEEIEKINLEKARLGLKTQQDLAKRQALYHDIQMKRLKREQQGIYKEAYKDLPGYETFKGIKSDITGSQSGAIGSTLLSAMTGGALNPVIIKALGIDKVAKGLTKSAFKGAGNLLGKAWTNRQVNKSKDTEGIADKSKSSGKQESVFAKDNEKNTKAISDNVKEIKDMVKTKQAPTEVKEEEQKSNIMDKLITGAKIASAIAGLAAGIYTGIKYFDQIKNILTKIGEFLNPIIKGISAIAKATWDAVTSIAEDATNAILSVKEGWDSVMNFFSDLGTAVGSEWSQFKELGLIGYLKAKFSGKGSTEPKVYKTQALAENQLKNMERAQTNSVDLNSIPLDKMTTAQRRVYLANQANDENGGGYGTFQSTHQSTDDVMIHNRPAKSLKSLSLAGSIDGGNSIPYIAEQNTDSLKKLDKQLHDWGYEIIYTSAMGGHKAGTGHWKGNKVDLQLKQNGRPAHLTNKQLQAIKKAGYWGSGTGALGWEPVSGQVGGGHYDLYVANGAKSIDSIPSSNTMFASNNSSMSTGISYSAKSDTMPTAEENNYTQLASIDSGIQQSIEVSKEKDTRMDFASLGNSGGGVTPLTSSPSIPMSGDGNSGFNISGGDSQTSSMQESQVYAWGDVAKTAILHTL